MPRIKISQTNIGSGIPLVPLTTAQAKALPNNTMFLDKSFQLSYKTNQGVTAPILNPTGGAIVPIGVTLLNPNGNVVNPSPWATIKFAGSAVSVTDVPEFGYSTVTIDQPVGVEYVANKNQPNGYAGLNSSGKIESAQLPSYVDDIEEYANLAALPGTGETGKIYVTLDNNKQYRWGGSVYVDINTAKQDTSEKNQPSGYAGLDAGGLIDFNQLPDLNLGTAANLDVAVSGNASAGEVVKGDDTRLSDARTPSAHTVGSHSDYPTNGYVTYDDVDSGIILLNRGDGYALDSGSDDLVFLYDGGTYLNTYFGSRAGKGPNIGVTASQNTAFGTEALTNITTGIDNIALGAFSSQGTVSGSRNIGIGTNSILSSNASDNIAIGYSSGSGLGTGSRNIAIGNYTLYANNVSGIITGTGQIAIGYETLYNANASSSQNTAIGYQSLKPLTSGANNTSIGSLVGNNLTSGSGNVFIGLHAGSGVSTGSFNIAIGNYSLYAVGSGVITTSGQVAIGNNALYTANNSSSANTAIGNGALTNLNTGLTNTAVGSSSGSAITSGSNNILFGYSAGAGITTSGGNVAIGTRTLYGNGSGVLVNAGQVAVGYETLYTAGASSSQNTAIGYQSLRALTSGTNNTTQGYQAGLANTTGSSNTSLGYFSGKNITIGSYNISIGSESGLGILSSSENIAIGYRTLYGNGSSVLTTAAGQIALGSNALSKANASSAGNISIGVGSTANLTSGIYNLVLGYQAGTGLSTGSYNVALGTEALKGNGLAVLTANGQVGVGYQSLYTANASSGQNTAIGYQSLKALTTGTDNTTLGYQSGIAQNTATGNTLVGVVAGHTITSGFYNTFMGNAVGTRTVLGANNTYIGRSANESTSLAVGETTGSVSNSIALGSLAQVDKSNKAQIGATTVVEFQFGTQFKLTTTQVIPMQTTETVELGSDDGVTPKRFNKINLNSVNLVNRTTDPATPASGVELYIKNGDLKFIDSIGTIKTVTAV